MSDFLTQLQQVDLAKILALISPTIIYFVAKEVKKPLEVNYKLVKDFKANSIKPIYLPAEVIRKYDSIDEKKILEKKFGELIINFAKVVQEKVPEINLAILLNNLNTLKTATKDFTTYNMLFNRNSAGHYTPETNTITLSENNYRITINHELFHAATAIYDKEHELFFCGFNQIKKKGKFQIAESLNEGYTQYITEKIFGKENTMTVAYIYEKRIAEALEMIVGEEKMRLFYFNANLNGLIEYLKVYNSEENIYKFINTLDSLTEHMDDKNLLPSSKKTIIDGFRFVNTFLIQTALKKKITDNNQSNFLTRDLLQDLVPLLKLIPMDITSEGRSFHICDENLITDILTTLFLEYKLSNDGKIVTK